ncbi:MAG: LysR family transcriptional regulator [Erysipelotrichaceae bacterium]|nr:LysR family transcriptional regulator [Erysipelotrichaceae bacterium]MDD3809296.1 LysR family transcriptional regulator [Erysipelotrichaceae bacterium]
MDLRLLEYFLSVVEAGNLSKAATNLHLTQPTLSRQLQQLEQIYGTKLFIRGNRTMTLTDGGMILKRRAQEILELNEKTIQEIQENERNLSGTIAIGCGESLGSTIVPKLIREFSQVHPRVKYQLYTGGNELSKEKINEGIVDCAIVLEPVDKNYYNYIELPYFDKWCVLMRKDDPLASIEVITRDQLEGMPLAIPNRKEVKETFNKWMGKDVSEQFKVEFDVNSNLGLLVKEGFCYGVTIEGAAQTIVGDELTYRLLEPEISSQAYLIWKKSVKMSRALEKFLESVNDIIGKLGSK